MSNHFLGLIFAIVVVTFTIGFLFIPQLQYAEHQIIKQCVCPFGEIKQPLDEKFPLHKKQLISVSNNILQKEIELPTITVQNNSCENDTIESKYIAAYSVPGDINEHIELIYDYVKNAQHATEIGVRDVVSSWAFAKAGLDRAANGKNFSYVASDITRRPAVKELDHLLNGCLNQIQYEFLEGDDLVIGPWNTDVILIDTWHSYRQLKAELIRWSPYVKDYILLHDTETYGFADELEGGHGGKPINEQLYSKDRSNKYGLWPAVEEFLFSNNEWSIHQKRTNNNGFTVLKHNSDNSVIIPTITQKKKQLTEVVIFIPTPVPWEDRRAAVYTQFVREGWTDNQVIMLFVLGTKDTNTEGVVNYASAKYVYTKCYDQGDRFNETGDNSATTCKVYEALRYISLNYEAKYVWRGADDSYVNLRVFFTKMPSLPPTRLFYGRLRKPITQVPDLQLSRQPALQDLLGLYQFGQYMYGMGFVMSFDVVDFIGSLKIPPHLNWCEDVMVGMWLNPFQIQFMDGGLLFQDPFLNTIRYDVEYFLIHHMTPEQWQILANLK